MKARYRLRNDELSNFSDSKGKTKVYGKKNDVVTEVADYGNVMIVEGKDGIKYPAVKTNLIKI